LGPTLEAYALLSKELQKNGLELWRTDKIFDPNKGKRSASNFLVVYVTIKSLNG
jgi:hypothetical protein